MSTIPEITTKKSVKIYPISTTLIWATTVLAITALVTNLSYFMTLIPPEYQHYDLIAGSVVLFTAFIFSILGMSYVDTEKEIFKNAAMICGFMLIVLIGILNAKAMSASTQEIQPALRNTRNLYSIFIVFGAAAFCGIILGNKSVSKTVKVSITLLLIGLMATIFVYKGNIFFDKSRPIVKSFVSSVINKTVTHDPMSDLEYK